MGVRAVCVGRTTGDEDLGFVGVTLEDEPRWVRPLASLAVPAPLPAMVAAGAPDALPDAEASPPAAGQMAPSGAGPVDPVLASAACLDVVDLATDGPRASLRGPEYVRVRPGESTRVGRLDERATRALLARLPSMAPTAAGLAAVVATEPTLLVLAAGDGEPGRRLALLWDDGPDVVEAPVLDPDLRTAAGRLPVGQHDPTALGLPEGDLLVVLGRERRPGQLLRRPAVLGVPYA